MKEPSKLSLFIEWILLKLGILEKREISKAEMCESVKSTCSRECEYCAWGDKHEDDN